MKPRKQRYTSSHQKRVERMARKPAKANRRHPLATVVLIAIGLAFTGGGYALFTSTATAQTDASTASLSQTSVDEGKKLFETNCATCHGLALEGSAAGPS